MSVMARHPEAFVAADWPDLAPDRHPETLAWVARIEAARLEEAPPSCPTCGSTVATTAVRCCTDCKVPKLLTAFPRNRAKRFGRDHVCTPCKGARNAAVKAARKRRQFRAILGVAS